MLWLCILVAVVKVWSQQPYVIINGQVSTALNLTNVAVFNGSEFTFNGLGNYLDIAGSALGNFGAGDFTVGFTWCGLGSGNVYDSPSGSSLFQRSTDGGPNYAGPSAFFYQNKAGIMFRTRARSTETACYYDLSLLASTICRPMFFERKNNVLSIWVDNLRICTNTNYFANPISDIAVINTRMRFGGNYANPMIQNIYGKIKYIVLTYPAGCTTGLSTMNTQYYAPEMSGCGGRVVYNNRASLCAAGFSPCSALQYKNYFNQIPPQNHYWVDDPLYFRYGSDKSCVVSDVGSGACQITVTAQDEMDSFSNKQVANYTGCGLYDYQNAFLSSCGAAFQTAGTLCCACGDPSLSDFSVVNGSCWTSDNCVHSPGHPQNYGNSQACTITVNSPGKLKVVNFNTEKTYDSMTVGNVSYSQFQGPNGVDVEMNAMITWKSDATTFDSGWRVCLSQPDKAATYFTVLSGSGCTVSGMCVTSANFPYNYSLNQNCTFIANDPGYLYVYTMDTELTHDYLQIDGVKYSGSAGPHGVHVSPVRPVFWRSDPSIVDMGWRVCWQPSALSTTWSTSGPCQVSGNCVSSQNYPSMYDVGHVCNIQNYRPGSIHIVSFNAGAGDSLEEDGTYYTNSNYMSLQGVVLAARSNLLWTSSTSSVSTGFKVCLLPVRWSSSSALITYNKPLHTSYSSSSLTCGPYQSGGSCLSTCITGEWSSTSCICKPVGCAAMPQQVFQVANGVPEMVGCGGTVTFQNRNDLCSYGYTSCSVNKYSSSFIGTAPSFNYWIEGLLYVYVSGSSGNCVLTPIFNGGRPMCGAPFRVCAGATDALGNICAQYTKCGYLNSTNKFLGGCDENSAGTLCCRVHCPNLALLSGTAVYSDAPNNNPLDSTVKVTCPANTEWSYGAANTTMTCRVNGAWDYAVGSCGCPTVNFPNGFVSYSDPLRVVGSTVAFNCASSFQLVGEPSTATCQSNGNWSSYGSCGCLNLGSILNGKVIYSDPNGFGVNSTANVSCQPFYQPNTPQLQCMNNKGWSSTAVCSDINECLNVTTCRMNSLCRNRVNASRACTPFFASNSLRKLGQTTAPTPSPSAFSEVFLPPFGGTVKMTFSWEDYVPIPDKNSLSLALTFVSSMSEWQQYSDSIAACMSPATFPSKFSWANGAENYNAFSPCTRPISAGQVPAVIPVNISNFTGPPGALDVQFVVPPGIGKGYTLILRQLSDVWSERKFGVANRVNYQLQQPSSLNLTACQSACMSNPLCVAVEWSPNVCVLLSVSPEINSVVTTTSLNQTHYARAWVLLASSSDKLTYDVPIINSLSLSTASTPVPGEALVIYNVGDTQITVTGDNFAPTNPLFTMWLTQTPPGFVNPTSSPLTLACPLDVGKSRVNVSVCTFPQNLFGRYTPLIKALDTHVWADTIFQVTTGAVLNSVDPSPNGFQTSGGDDVTVRGVGFTSTSTVTIDGQPCPVKSFFMNATNATSLTCSSPPGTGLRKPIVVREGGFFTLPLREFDYLSPTILTVKSSACDGNLQNCNRTGGNLVITATNLAGSESLSYAPTVNIGTQLCRVQTIEMTNHPQGRHEDRIVCSFTSGYASFNQITVAQFNGISQSLTYPLGFAPCPAGTFEQSIGLTVVTECGLCAPGKFQNLLGQTQCMDCLQGRYAVGNANTICALCPAGSYQNQSAQSGCFPCGVGTRTPEGGRAECERCSPGRSANHTNSSFCDACDRGKFAEDEGMSSCIDCAAGFAGSQPQLVRCDPCGEGHYSSTNGSKRCEPCTPGTYQSNKSATTCTPCEAGRAQGGGGQADCMMCLKGSYAEFSNSTRCEQCAPGKAQSEDNASSCELCGTGRFAFSFSTTECESCASGQFCNSPGCKECTKCERGHYQSDINATSCNLCQPGNYSNVEGAPECKRCVGGTFSNQTGRSECEKCAMGYFQDLEEQQNCTACEMGRYARTEARTVCEACAIGTFNSQTAQSGCIDCDVGKFQGLENQSSCALCPRGKYTNSRGLDGCTECSPGYYAESEGLTTCTLCPIGRAQNSSGQSACVECEAGEVAPVAGYRFCTKCKGTNFASHANSSCAVCPTFSSISLNGSSCICQAGYYSVPFALADAYPTVDELSRAAAENRNLRTDAVSLGFFCMQCPAGANCFANGTSISTVQAQAGWSTDREGLKLAFFQCPIPSSCLPQGCAGGFTGSLCKACETGYGAVSGGVCTQCLDRGWELGRLTLIVIAVITLLALFVYQTRHSALKDSSSFMIAAKILVSGMQFNALALSMNFKFVTTVANLLNTQSTVSQLGLQSIFSSDCALESPDYNPVLVSSGLFLFSPVLVLLCTLPFAAIAAACTRHRRKQELDAQNEITVDDTNKVGAQDYEFVSLFKNYAITGTVIIVFIIHPMLTKKAFELFNCVKIGIHPDESFLYADLSIQCYAYPHIVWVLLLGLPLLIVTVGEPLVFASFLHKHKAQLTQANYKLTYSFLYKGYQPALWSVWEVSIMARKSAIVAIAVFGNKSTRIQALLAVALCFVVLGFHQTYKPFLDPWLNRLELLSIVTSATLYFFAQFLLQTTTDVTGQAQDLSQVMIVIFQILFLVCALIFIFYGVFHKFKSGVLNRRMTKQRLALEMEMGQIDALPLTDTTLPSESENPKTFFRQESSELSSQPEPDSSVSPQPTDTEKIPSAGYYHEPAAEQLGALYAPYTSSPVGNMYAAYSDLPGHREVDRQRTLESAPMPTKSEEED